MITKTAIVIGSTGMVGQELIAQLIASSHYTSIVSLVRRPSGTTNTKLKEHVIDFEKPETWKELVKGDELFACLGTTIAQAKTKEAQYKVDYSYQYNVAKIASDNGVENFILVSSAGANVNSKTFYIKMKGELDEAVQHLPFEHISILRPGQLTGKRIEKRMGERIGLVVMNALNKIGILKRYRPITFSDVAKAMIHAAKKNKSAIYTLNEVHKLAK